MKKILLAALVPLVIVLGWAYYAHTTSQNPDVVKIGFIAPLTGDVAILGERMKNGMELAREDLIAKGVVGDIDIVYEDACFPKEYFSAAQKLINIDKVKIIGASLCIPGLTPTVPFVQQSQTIVFNTAVNPDNLLNQPNIFSTNLSIKDDATKLAVFARNKLGAKTAAVLNDANPFGEDYKKYFAEEFESLGGAILVAEHYDLESQTDFRTQLTKIKQKDPDTLLVISFGSSLGTIIKQSHELGIRAQLLGHYEAEDPTVLEFAGPSSEGFIISAIAPTKKTPDMLAYEQKYYARFGELPDVHATNTYDALHLQVVAYLKCNGDIACMKKEFFATKNYQGVSGPISIKSDGSADKETIFKVVKNGKFVELK